MKVMDILASLYERNISLEVSGDSLKVIAKKGAVDQDALASIRRHKQDIINLLKDIENKKQSQSLILTRHPDTTSAPLSFEQKAMLYLDKVTETKHHYNMSAAYKLRGKLDRHILSRAFTDVVIKYAILRTTYSSVDNIAEQNINTPKTFVVSQNKLAKTESLGQVLEAYATLAFDLNSEWPIRAALLDAESPSDECYLCITLHHIVADGWSVAILLRELSEAYNYLLDTGSPRPTNNHYAQYYDYAYWQISRLQGERTQFLLDYWKERLQSLPAMHNLPTDFPRPAVQNFNGAVYKQSLPRSLNDQIQDIVSQKNTTPFIVFQTIFAALLKRYSGNNDIVFGTVSANRSHPELMGAIGMFANSLVLRYDIDDACNFSDLLNQVAKTSQESFDHGELPFDVLVESLQPERSLSYNPLVQIMLVMQEDYHQQLKLNGVESSFIDNDRWVSKFDLSLHLTNKNNLWELRWEFNTSLFKPETVERIHRHFIRMAELLFSDSKQAISQLPLITLQELPGTHTVCELPADNYVYHIFEKNAFKTPGKAAVVTENGQLNYQQLNERVEHLAQLLSQSVVQATVSKPPFIGVCLERNADLLVSLLAIFKMGGVYVPIDPAYPKERIQHMVSDSGITLLLTSTDIQKNSTCFNNVSTFIVDEVEQAKKDLSASIAYPPPRPDQPAYLIYTSGSTGKPKGVLVSHSNLFHSLHANSHLMHFTHQDVMPCLGSVAFGASLLEMLLPLTNGGTVHMLSKSSVADITDLITLTMSSSTVIHMVPSLMKIWLRHLTNNNAHKDRKKYYPDLRLILTGGEAVPKHLLAEFQALLPDINILGLYGMTEAAIVCFSHAPDNKKDDDPTHCLGVPHPHMQALVLNSQQQLQPVGCTGELHLSGASLALGYLNQEAYTQERFISDSPILKPEQRLYKTGDCTRLLNDGRFEFLGRIDNQISIRGFRIELGEIESCLRTHSSLREVLVIDRTSADDHKQLVAYYTINDDSSGKVNASELRQYLSNALPNYMVPAHFVLLHQFPLNPNGKIDRKALSEIEISEEKQVYVKPSSDKEKILTKIWSKALDIPFEHIGTEDNFFALGGDSILSLEVIEMARAENIIITPQKFFQHQTIAELANLSLISEPEYEKDVEGPLALTPIQKSVFCEKTYDWNHRHSTVMRNVPIDITAESWSKAFKTLLVHHPVLRSRFQHHENQNWSAKIVAVPTSEQDFFERIDCSVLNDEEQETKINQCLYKTIDITKGPLVKLFLFENIEENKNTLLFIGHHFVLDQVSIKIVSDDLYDLVDQINQKKSPSLPKNTAPVRQIVSAINEYSKSIDLHKDIDYWLSLPLQKMAVLPSDFPQEKNYYGVLGNDKFYQIELSKEETRRVIKGLKKIPGLDICSIIVMCIVNAVAEWSGRQMVKVDVMNNGRSLLPGMEDINTSRTVGYLCMFMTLCLKKTDDASIISIQKMYEQIKAIPHDGLGYDLLYWANEELPDEQKINFPIHVNEKSFILNYHGALGRNGDSFLDISESSADYTHHPKNSRISQLYIHALILDGELVLNMNYGSELYKEETVVKIMKKIKGMLKEIGENLKGVSDKVN